jgi:hypothetical protein
MTALIVAAFGMLLLLRLLLPVATVAATTEADIERLLSEMDAPVDAVDVEG